jgi:hypothetical protein
MSVIGKLQAPAALSPKKEPPVPIGQEAERTPDMVYLTLPESNTDFPVIHLLAP